MERILRHPWLVIGVIALGTVFFGLQLPRVELDNNNFRFVPQDNQARRLSAAIDDQFGSSLFILVGLERPYGDIFDPRFLMTVRDFVAQVEEMELVGKVNSVMTSDYITGEGDAIVVEKLSGGGFTGRPEEAARLRERLLSWDMYRRVLVSDDLRATQIVVPMEVHSDDAGKPEVVASFLKIRDMAKAAFAGQARVYVTGLPVIAATINEAIRQDLVVLIPIVVLVVLFVVWLPLGRIGFVFLSVLAVLVAVIWSVGAMPLLGVKLSVITTVMPVVLIAVGNSYGLHVVVHYIEGREEREEKKMDFTRMSREEHFAYILRLVRSIQKPVFLATITTVVSFASFAVTRISPIREFGVFSSFGVLVSFIVAMTLLPAILVLRGPRALASRRGGAGGSHQVAEFFMRLGLRKKTVLVVTALIAVVSLVGAARVVIDNVFVEYFKAGTDIVRADAFIRARFGGSKAMSVVVTADSPEALLHPDVLSAVDGLEAFLTARLPETGKVMGFTDLVKRINQVFNANESPGGLRPRAAAEEGGEAEEAMEAEEKTFGFGFDEEEAASPAPASLTPLSAAVPEGPPLNGVEMAALVDRAARSVPEGRARDLAWEIKRAVNYQGAAYYEIPADPARYGKKTPEDLQRLVSNYLVLLSGDISEYANDPLEPTAIRLLIQLRVLGQRDTDRVLAAINDYGAANFPPTVKFQVGGPALVEKATNSLVVSSVWQSMSIAIVFLFAIVALVNRSALAGLIGIVPLLILIVVNLAIMGFTGIKLNVGTALIFSLTMGIGIDYTIHFMEAYKRELRERRAGEEPLAFLRRAYLTSGVAILADAGSTGAGFAVLLLSQFTMLAEFGLLVACSLTLSALVGLVLVPALLMLLRKREWGSGEWGMGKDISAARHADKARPHSRTPHSPLPFLLALLLAAPLLGADPVEGFWLSVDDQTGKTTAGWEVYIHDGRLYGTILSMADYGAEVPAARCKESYPGFPLAGPVNRMPVVGTPWIFGLERDGEGRWSGGRIINPEDGKMWKCRIVHHPAGGKYPVETLEMRGEIGLGIGRSQYWSRTTRAEAGGLRGRGVRE